MSAGQEAAITLAVDGFEEAGQILQLDGARVKDLERAVLTAAIDLNAVRMIVWGFDCAPDGREFSSPECRQLWKHLLAHSPGHNLVPTREEVRQAFPSFRFVRAPFPLLQLAAKLFRTPRFVRAPASRTPALHLGRGRRGR